MDNRKEIIENILSELNGRSGFDDWWCNIDEDIQEEITETLVDLLPIYIVSGSSIRIPKPCLKFEGLDNLSIVSENPIPLSDLFELHLKLENYLKTRHETILNNDGLIVGFKNYR